MKAYQKYHRIKKPQPYLLLHTETFSSSLLNREKQNSETYFESVLKRNGASTLCCSCVWIPVEGVRNLQRLGLVLTAYRSRTQSEVNTQSLIGFIELLGSLVEFMTIFYFSAVCVVSRIPTHVSP